MNIVKNKSIRLAETTEKNVLEALKQMVEDWKNYFEVPPPKDFAFTKNSQGMLCIDGIAICQIADVNIQDLSCGCDAFFIGSKSRGYYRISIIWTYTDLIYVDEVSLVVYSR